MSLQREIQERPLRADQLHRRREPALHESNVDRSEHLVEVMDVRAVLDALVAGVRARPLAPTRVPQPTHVPGWQLPVRVQGGGSPYPARARRSAPPRAPIAA